MAELQKIQEIVPHNVRTSVTVDEEKDLIVLKHQYTDKNSQLVLSMELPTAGELITQLTNAILYVHARHAGKLPVKSYEPKSGSNY